MAAILIRRVVTTLFVPICVLSFVLSMMTTGANAAGSDHTLVTSSSLKWAEVPSLPKGAQVAMIEGPLNEAVPFTFRIKMVDGYKIPAHWHPTIEHVTVISGIFNMGMGDKFDESKTQPLQAGDMMILQPKTQHFAWAKGDTVVQVHGTGPWAINFVNPADDPRKK